MADEIAKTTDALIERFAATALERDRAGGTPKLERGLIRKSGLLGLIVPRAQGGLGASWPRTLGVVRRFATVDASLAHVFGFQHLLLATLRLFGAAEQYEPLFAATVERSWFWGNALNPLDARTQSERRGSGFIFHGTKLLFRSRGFGHARRVRHAAR